MLPIIDAERLTGLISYPAAVEAIRTALDEGGAAAGPPRTTVPLDHGHLLVMTAQNAQYAGVKIAGVAPGNPARGLPRITGLYLLHDATTLVPTAVFDGATLTLLRTSAVSAVAADLLSTPDAARLLLYGTGPQAWAHVQALRTVRPITTIDVAGRTREAARAFAERCASAGIPVRPAESHSVEQADIIACCTSASTPLFDGRLLAPHATVLAMGSHTLDAREVDDHTVNRSTVVVEERATALREAGDVAGPVQSGALAAGDLVELADLAQGRGEPLREGPRLFKSVGMAWQDLAVASAAMRQEHGHG